MIDGIQEFSRKLTLIFNNLKVGININYKYQVMVQKFDKVPVRHFGNLLQIYEFLKCTF